MRRQYRRGVGFVMDELAHSTRLDRNAKARLLHACEALERATKAPGQRNGTLGQHGLAVLRALLLGFHNHATGLCIPSYDAIQRRTGFCRQTVAKAIAALEALGVLKVTRRIVRVATSAGIVVRAGSNIYGFADPGAKLLAIGAIFSVKHREGPRVYRAACNHKPQYQELEQVAPEVGLRWAPTKMASDWRDRARGMFAIICNNS